MLSPGPHTVHGSFFGACQARDQGDRVFPDQYAESLVSRACSATNLHLNEDRVRAFRPITKSGIYNCTTQKVVRMASFRHRLRLVADTDTQAHPAATTDVLPFLNHFGVGSEAPATGNGECASATGPLAMLEEDIDDF